MSDTNPPATKPIKVFYLKNLSSQDAHELGGFPWSAATIPPRPGLQANATKAQYSAWCSGKKLDWYFYSMCEGLTPSLRISGDNPAKYRHGIVIDYDAKTTVAAAKQFIYDNAADGLLPAAAGLTFSNQIRVAWVFEEPLLLDNKELGEVFMKVAFKHLKAKRLMAGADESSLTEKQYFELGSDWETFPESAPIPLNVLHVWLSEAFASMKAPLKEYKAVPYEKINEEIDRQFPGRVQTPVQEGQNVPLFWINDGIDRLGATMGERGVLVWSTREGRATNSLMPWEKIFGKKFMDDYEAERTGQAAADFWWDGETFWQNNGDKRFSKRTTEFMRLRLRIRYGLDESKGKKDLGSEVEKVLLDIQDTKEVAGIGMFPFVKEDVVTLTDGRRFLNASTVKPCSPADNGDLENFPWLAKYFGIEEGCPGIWDDTTDENGHTQRDYFLAWLKHFYLGAHMGAPTKGHAVFIAGDVNVGKSLLALQMMDIIAGGKADATNYLLGKTNFNEEMSRFGYWTINDSVVGETQKSRDAFASRIKEFVANPILRVEAKRKEAFTTDCFARVMITCNTTDEGLSIIPPIGSAIKDKLMLFKCGDWRPEFKNSYSENKAMLQAEMPYFLRWLCDWKVPPAILHETGHRYFVKEFLHPDLVAHSRELDASTGLLNDLNDLRHSTCGELFDGSATEWRGTAGELLTILFQFRPAAKYSTITAGRWMSGFIRTNAVPWLTREEASCNRKFYKVARPSKD